MSAISARACRRATAHSGIPLRTGRGWLVLRLTLAAAVALAAPVAVQGQAIDRALARAYFAEADAISAADSARLWGVALYGPVLFVDRATREIVANAADSAAQLSAEGELRVGRLPDGVGIFNGGIDWGGRRWTMLAWPLPYGRFERQRLMAHELFHRLQPQLGLPAANPGNEHLDRREARIWLRLEWRALQDALAHDGESRRRALVDALRFRAERHRHFPEGVESERLLELNEGLAEYTGVRVGVPAPVRIGWVVRQLETSDARARTESVVRNFAYASGAAYGVLLEAVDPHWTRQVTPATDLGALLATLHALDVGADRADLQARTARYAGTRLVAEETAREARRVAQQAEFHTRFVTGATLVLPTTAALAYSFDPNAVVPFDAGGTVYLTMQAQDAWGTLNVTEGGALLRLEGERGTIVVPAAPEGGAALRGPGWELRLADGWELAAGTWPGEHVVVRRP